jgi:hypothetical protein
MGVVSVGFAFQTSFDFVHAIFKLIKLFGVPLVGDVFFDFLSMHDYSNPRQWVNTLKPPFGGFNFGIAKS